MSSIHRNTPDEELEPPPEGFGPTITIQSVEFFNRKPSEVYHYLGKHGTITHSLPALRALHLIDGDIYSWKLEFDTFELAGELHFTQKLEGDIVLWQATESSPTQATGSMRFHAVDEPVENSEDESPTTRLTTTLHLRLPAPLIRKIGDEEIQRRVSISLKEALARIKHSLELGTDVPTGLRREDLVAAADRPHTGKKDSPLR